MDHFVNQCCLAYAGVPKKQDPGTVDIEKAVNDGGHDAESSDQGFG
jgi:hypothetical protein